MHINLKDDEHLFREVIRCMKANLLAMLENSTCNEKIAEQCAYVRDVIRCQSLWFESEPTGLSLVQLINCLRSVVYVYMNACEYKKLLCIAELLVDTESLVRE
jgi:hypothetical protein